jgi:hypothetical protein
LRELLETILKIVSKSRERPFEFSRVIYGTEKGGARFLSRERQLIIFRVLINRRSRDAQSFFAINRALKHTAKFI